MAERSEPTLSPEDPGYNHGRRSLCYVRWTYKVPARRGMRVRADGNLGTITCGDGQYVRVRLDGEKRSLPYHPTWRMEYEPDEAVSHGC